MRTFTRREILAGLVSSVIVSASASRFAFGRESEPGKILNLDVGNGVVDGGGVTVFIKKPIILRAGHYANINFVPGKEYNGPGPIFMANNGKVIHENISISGFSGAGCKVLSSLEKGNSFTAIGICRYSNNGNLQRTLLTTDSDMRFSSFIIVKKSSMFRAGDYIWVGDGKFKVREVKDNKVYLVMSDLPNIISPKVFSGGYDKCKEGQFVTLHAEDSNGIRIGNGGFGWDIDTSLAKIDCSHNGRSGFFHSCKKYNGKQVVENITAIGNGYINIGMGYMNDGWIKKCVTRDSGNNCIDVFESKGTVSIYDNVVSGSGVDGIFVGGNGESAKVYDNQVSHCHRIGILINARKNPIKNIIIKNNQITESGMNSITLTAVESGDVMDNTLDGSINRQAIFLEKRNGLSLSGVLNISDNNILNAKSGDIGTNYSGYTNDHKAKVSIKSSRKLVIDGISGY
ncbi:right-handed parallel beta-helix repeat-containing protein [Raoultella ornithinolytica]|uniref:right-handed parallel beta-helix repeat-containing protein n=1 Tax=Raoultella ornithinolytica TaxID=54291 RepID=UPI0011AFBDC7|nr:right-handed parallel beta-helix repeat-containing protein [Raoultella ornithinolytica]